MIHRFSLQHSKRAALLFSNQQVSKIRVLPLSTLVTSATVGAVLSSSSSATSVGALLFPITSTGFSTIAMPARPYAFLKGGADLLDLSVLNTEVTATEEKRQAAYEASHKIKAKIVRAQADLISGKDDPATIAELEASLVETVGATADRMPRDGALNYRVEEFVQHKAFLQFLEDGTLLAPSRVPYATDEEYLSGVMGLAQDLAKYGLGRATARDSDSVKMAKDLVQQILEYLLQFDFRNGALRRKYDGTKYALRSLETLLYELAVTGTSEEEATGEKPTKIHKPNESTRLMENDEFKGLQERMAHRDNLRENLIKKFRDGQKAAKQAIYALHRGDANKAKTLIDQCETIVQEHLLPTVQEEPQLRYAGFVNGMLEEYAEAKLFYAWLFEDTTQVPSTTPATLPAKLLQREDFEPIKLEPDEYLGGICDLTGEVGRFAVQRATLRDKEGVLICLQTNKSIQTALQMMAKLPNPKSIGRKLDQLNQSVGKIERILYEMSLSEATGGRNVKTDSMDIEPASKGGGNDDS